MKTRQKKKILKKVSRRTPSLTWREIGHIKQSAYGDPKKTASNVARLARDEEITIKGRVIMRKPDETDRQLRDRILTLMETPEPEMVRFTFKRIG